MPEAENEIGWLEIGQLARFIIGGHACALTNLVKTVFIKQRVNALANGQTSFCMVGFNRLFTALLFGKFAPLLNLINVFIPIHGSLHGRDKLALGNHIALGNM